VEWAEADQLDATMTKLDVLAYNFLNWARRSDGFNEQLWSNS
jgi:hypothetical protein